MRQLTKERLGRPDSKKQLWKCRREKLNRSVLEPRGVPRALQQGGPTRSFGLRGSKHLRSHSDSAENLGIVLGSLNPFQRKFEETENTAQVLYFVHLRESSSSPEGEMFPVPDHLPLFTFLSLSCHVPRFVQHPCDLFPPWKYLI